MNEQEHSTPNAGAEPGEKNTSSIWAEHIEVLRARAIPVEFAIKHGLKSVDVSKLKDHLAKYKKRSAYPELPLYRGARGILIPYPNTAIDGIPRCRIRVDKTEVTLPGPVDGTHHGEKIVTIPRYICQSRPITVVPYILPEITAIAGDTTKAIFVVEAPLKALSLTAHGFMAIGLGGVLAGATDKEALEALGEILISKEMGFIRWTGRTAYIVFDAGLHDNPMVALGAARLALALQREGADVRLVSLPYCHPTESDPEAGRLYFKTDQGPDDYIARNGVEEFKKLIEGAVPADPIARVAIAATSPNRVEAVARLLGEVPVQAMIHEGGAILVDQVAAAMKASGVSKRAVQEAVKSFKEKLTRRAEAAESETWKSKLRRTEAGKVESTADNVMTILAHDPKWAMVLAYNEFSERVVLRKPAPWDEDDAPKVAHEADQEVSDADDFRFVAWIGRRFKMKITTQMAHDAVCTASERNRFHPVREYLRGITWDGVARLGSKDAIGWLTTYLGVEDKRYTRVVGRMWMISAVARIFQPGCFVKMMLVLCGPQDAKKSSAFAVLGGDWYMDDLRDIHSKDACGQLGGKWVVEMGEMAAWGKADAETGKRFVSTKVDNYRDSYGRRNRDHKRQSVFGGTTNVKEFINDHTGGTRFMPVDVGQIDLDGLRTFRDQLWAEAVVAYDQGERWWTEDKDEVADLRQEQAERRKSDPWEHLISQALDFPEVETTDENSTVVRTPRPPMTEVTMSYILDAVLRVPVVQQTPQVATRVGAAMHVLGWTKGRRRENGSRAYYYVRTVSGEGASPAVPTVPTGPTPSGSSTTDSDNNISISSSSTNPDPGGDSRDSRDSPLDQGISAVPTSNGKSFGGQDGRDSKPAGIPCAAPMAADTANSSPPSSLAAASPSPWVVADVQERGDGRWLLLVDVTDNRRAWVEDPTGAIRGGQVLAGIASSLPDQTLHVEITGSWVCDD